MVNFAQIVAKGLSLRGERVALETQTSCLTGKKILAYIAALGNYFDLLKLKSGDRVLLVNDGDIYFVIFYLALIQRGLVVVPSTADDRAQFGASYLADRVNPAFIISMKSGNNTFADIIPGCSYNIDPYFSHTRDSNSISDELAKLKIAALMFTSGTTGEPKGVMVSHQNLCVTLDKNIHFQKLSMDTVELNTLPLTHSFGLGQLNATLAAGGKEIIFPRLSNLGRMLKLARKKEVTSFPTTPAGIGILLGRYAAVFQESFTSLQTIMVNSAPLPTYMARSIMDLFPNVRLLVYYGLTEASRSTYADLSETENSYLNSVGRPLGNTEVSVLSETSEILITGDNVSPGYFNTFEKGLSIHPNGVLHTGDKGELITGDRLVIKGRLSNELNVGGYKVDPLEIEQLVYSLGTLDQACLTAVETSGAIFETVLFVCSKKQIDLDKVRQKLSSKLEAHKIPIHILQVDLIPTSLNGKVNRVEAHNMAKVLLE